MIKKNDLMELNIDSITNLGFGVGRYNGLVIFVSDCVPGDVVLCKIIKTTPSYAVGRVEKFIEKSTNRDESRCQIPTCKSCAYKSISYELEKKIKAEDIKEVFAKVGLPDVKVAELIGSSRHLEYRNKAQYPISKAKDGSYVIGFYAPKSHRVMEARNCPLSPKPFPEIIDTVANFFAQYNLSVYDDESGTGILRHVYLRRGEISGEILLTLVINSNTLPYSEELVKAINEKHSDVVGVLININKKKTNVILGSEYKLLSGRDYIYDTLAGVKLKISAPAFYQVNHVMAELLYKKAKELAMPTKEDVVLDLFCGTGSIGLSMAKDAGELIGIEIVDSAVVCARENAEASGIYNAKFYTGDATGTENLLSLAEKELGIKITPSIVILDPPRAGCDEKLIKFIASLSPKRVVYISCNPATLARDAALFKNLGYSFDELFPFDLFPMTGHVESVVCLTRN